MTKSKEVKKNNQHTRQTENSKPELKLELINTCPTDLWICLYGSSTVSTKNGKSCKDHVEFKYSKKDIKNL